MDSFLSAILEQIIDCEMVCEDDGCLLGVSGGADSMALLHGMARLRDSGRLTVQRLCVGHLNHQLRGAESDEDAEFVRRESEKLGLEVVIGSSDIKVIAKKCGESIELTARRERYRFLAGAARQTGCGKIALAHNADDNIETILHRIIRGTGIRGLAGIPAVRELDPEETAPLPAGPALQLIRPLLKVTRSKVESFLQRHELDYRLDRTNLSRDHTRNRIRRELLPLLQEHYNPEIGQALGQLGQITGMVNEILHADAKEALEKLTLEADSGGLALDAAGLTDREQIRQAEIIYQALLKLKIPQQRIGFKQIKAVLELISKPAAGMQSILLPYGVQVELQGGRLRIGRTAAEKTGAESPVFNPVSIPVPGTVPLPESLLWYDSPGGRASKTGTLQTEIIAVEQDAEELLRQFRRSKGPQEEMIDYDCLKGELSIRPFHPGDRFHPLGAAGGKKLGDFLTDHKVPGNWRGRLGLVCDDRGVVWVMGLRIAERVRVTPHTHRILRLRINYT